jgi:cellobiose-specific phosphotransferase system component IIA
VRSLACRTLAPSGQSLRPNFGEKDSAILCNAKACLKRAHERHVQLAEKDAINSHTVSFLRFYGE